MTNHPPTTYRTISLLAPVSGKAVPLSEVPCPLIHQGLLGYGVAIEPTGSRILAPCNGKITDMAATGHQLTISNDHGVIFTIIIGYNGLNTHGLGYNKKVSIGDIVSEGQALVELDLPRLKARLTSHMVAVLITKGVLRIIPQLGLKRAGEDGLLKIIIKE